MLNRTILKIFPNFPISQSRETIKIFNKQEKYPTSKLTRMSTLITKTQDAI